MSTQLCCFAVVGGSRCSYSTRYVGLSFCFLFYTSEMCEGIKSKSHFLPLTRGVDLGASHSPLPNSITLTFSNYRGHRSFLFFFFFPLCFLPSLHVSILHRLLENRKSKKRKEKVRITFYSGYLSLVNLLSFFLSVPQSPPLPPLRLTINISSFLRLDPCRQVLLKKLHFGSSRSSRSTSGGDGFLYPRSREDSSLYYRRAKSRRAGSEYFPIFRFFPGLCETFPPATPDPQVAKQC